MDFALVSYGKHFSDFRYERVCKIADLKLTNRKVLVTAYLQLSSCYSESKLDDGADRHADCWRRVHFVPHGVTVNLQKEA